jgi:hypothetical protein
MVVRPEPKMLHGTAGGTLSSPVYCPPAQKLPLGQSLHVSGALLKDPAGHPAVGTAQHNVTVSTVRHSTP